jgi:hypothetical protein
MCVHVPTHARGHTHNPTTLTATNQFVRNVMPFTVKLETFCKHPNFTYTFTFIKAFPEQQINQELVSFWKLEVVTMFNKSNNMLNKVKKKHNIQC